MKGKAADDKIMHCLLKIGDSTIMASDSMSDEENPITVGNNISLTIGMDDVPRAENMFEKLSDGGTVAMPMQETFWGRAVWDVDR